uniref:hypothetical protein n=1 Tax=Burkholderia sp. CCA53 TaxID=1776288 RepID=UPI0020C75BAD
MDAVHAVNQVVCVVTTEALERLGVNDDSDALAGNRFALGHVEAVLDDCEAVALALVVAVAALAQERLHRQVSLSRQHRDDLFLLVEICTMFGSPASSA